jgi:hypothetical protein
MKPKQKIEIKKRKQTKTKTRPKQTKQSSLEDNTEQSWNLQLCETNMHFMSTLVISIIWFLPLAIERAIVVTMVSHAFPGPSSFNKHH